MKILVTGAGGFIGKNLVAALEHVGVSGSCPELGQEIVKVLCFGRESEKKTLERYTAECDFVYHLAGVNRPEKPEAFEEVNTGLTCELLSLLEKHGNKAPVVLASSVQAEKDNPYGKSKKKAERLVTRYGRKNDVETFIYRLPNIFGKWCRPYYNSVAATFCHQISRGLPIHINNPEAVLQLAYIDDVITAMLGALTGGDHRITETYEVTVGSLAEKIEGFRENREKLEVPDMADPLTKKLYSAYLTYLSVDNLSQPLKTHTDARGAFAEFIKTPDRGQLSVNITKAGVTRGDHWHHTKNEKFLVVRGTGRIRLRRLGSDRILEYPVSGEQLEVMDIPAGYTHALVNDGSEDMVTLIWACEIFDPQQPDTYSLAVEPEIIKEVRRNEKAEAHDDSRNTD